MEKNALAQKLASLEGEYLRIKGENEELSRKVGELDSDLARVSRRVLTEDFAEDLCETLVESGFVKTAHRKAFVERILDHPEEIPDVVRKVASASVQEDSAVQVGNPSGSALPASGGLDPLAAYALS